jgi:DNA repair exonuclease SbcCD ATPase subunit
MDNGRFRSTAFGGFHRQDVLDYIEYSTKDFTRQLEEKQQTIDSLQQNSESLSNEVAQLQGRLNETMKEAEDAAKLRERLSALQQERDALAERLNAALARLNRIEPDYTQYEAIKDRIAEIELNAHSHAAMIEGKPMKERSESANS